jgi:FkbM family methyltransferase
MITTCDVNGLQIRLDVTSNTEDFRARTYASKEPETLEWIDAFFEPGEVFYDIGANIGLYSLYTALRHAGMSVFAFEPEALNFAKLNVNILTNGLSGRVTPYCLAIAGQLRLDVLNIHPYASQHIEEGAYAPGSAMHAFGPATDFSGREFTPLHVQGAMGVSVDALVGQFGLPFPDHVKIDIDGLEEEAIRGMRATLADPRLKSVLIEISGSQGQEDPICAELLSHGFRQFTDFRDHSSRQLQGTPYQDSVNTVFTRRYPGRGRP